jgi:hypothetical protein
VQVEKDVVVSLSGPIGDASAVANLNNQTMSMIMANGEEKSKKKHTHAEKEATEKGKSLANNSSKMRRTAPVDDGEYCPSSSFFLLLPLLSLTMQ